MSGVTASGPTAGGGEDPKLVRIGGASGFWGDSAIATPQLLQVPGLQFLVYDYLAETTMAILARARAKNPAFGYATDFVDAAMAPHLKTLIERGVRVVANAGGLNPAGCAAALRAVAQAQGLNPRIVVVEGDDLLDRLPGWVADGTLRMLDGAACPPRPLSANAYTGAQPIARALDAGADIVITGRCVDSAVVVGVLAHAFGWTFDAAPDDAPAWHRLAGGTLAGHVIECGAQATGGLFTDWQQVPDWAHIGYPVIDVASDGSFLLSKPAGTGGVALPAAVAEQVLYEIGDPASYRMPDVTVDLRGVQVRAVDADHVQVSGARGRPPGPHYKGNLTWRDGFQLQQLMALRGPGAALKARRTADALIQRTREQMAARGFADYAEVSIELLGCEALYGPHAQDLPTREVVLRLAVRHADAAALAVLQREAASPGTSMAPGTRSTFSGRADIQAMVKLASYLVDKTALPQRVHGDGIDTTLPCAAVTTPDPGADAGPAPIPPLPASDEATRSVPLLQLAWARSGDKGDDANIGVIAREARWLPLLRRELTAARVQAWFAHRLSEGGHVERFDLPGLNAMNFLLHRALGGGGVCSLQSDPLGKSYAQMLLDMPIDVPLSLAP